VHQGNGTAKLMENVDQVFTFSVHGKNNYPFRKEKSDVDIGLEDGASIALGGGYSPDIKDIVEAHCNTFRLALDLFD
jgi:acetoin utilization deacetylase AcuC-like enzyme